MSLIVDSRRSFSVKRIPDIDYVSSFEKHYHSLKHKLDIYVPISSGEQESKFPVVVFAHGGGWKKGDRYGAVSKLHQNVGESLASKGYVACIISYRMSSVRFVDTLPAYFVIGVISFICSLINRGGAVSSTTLFDTLIVPSIIALYAQYLRLRFGGISLEHPSHVEDLVSALLWTSNHIENFGGDPTKLAVMGHSAGAHMAMMLALTKYNDIKDLMPKNSLRAVVCLSGVFSAEYLLHGTPEDPTWLVALGFIQRWYRRVFYLRAAFGVDPRKWSVSFPCGLLEAVLRRRDENSFDDHTVNVPSVSSTLPFPILFINCKDDWGLHFQTDRLIELLNDCYKSVEIKKVRLSGGNHVSYLMDISHKGRIGEDQGMGAVDDFLHEAFERRNSEIPPKNIKQ